MHYHKSLIDDLSVEEVKSCISECLLAKGAVITQSYQQTMVPRIMQRVEEVGKTNLLEEKAPTVGTNISLLLLNSTAYKPSLHDRLTDEYG